MTIITGQTGRKYEVDSSSAIVFNEAKAKYIQAMDKIIELEKIHNPEWSGLDDDDSQIALNGLVEHYQKKVRSSQEIIDHIISGANDVTGIPQ